MTLILLVTILVGVMLLFWQGMGTQALLRKGGHSPSPPPVAAAVPPPLTDTLRILLCDANGKLVAERGNHSGIVQPVEHFGGKDYQMVSRKGAVLTYHEVNRGRNPRA